MYDELVKALRLCVKLARPFDALANAEQAADAIEELTDTNVGEWIPVTERLPDRENDGYYVLVYEDGDIMMASYSGGEWYLRDMYEIIELKPTHWMPLPEPPKEET